MALQRGQALQYAAAHHVESSSTDSSHPTEYCMADLSTKLVGTIVLSRIGDLSMLTDAYCSASYLPYTSINEADALDLCSSAGGL